MLCTCMPSAILLYAEEEHYFPTGELENVAVSRFASDELTTEDVHIAIGGCR